MEKVSGTFFDGVSSIPHKVEVSLDRINASLIVEESNVELFRLAIEETTYDRNGNVLIVHLKNNPARIVKIEDADFIHEYLLFLKENGHLSWYQRLIGLGMKVHIAIAGVILGLIVVAYFFIIPWVAENAVLVIPPDYDNKMGATFFNEFVRYNEVDTAKTKALNAFASQLNLKNSKKLKFTVIKSETVNAFALPDGNVIVYTGIIQKMQQYDELVGLLGHEVAHVNERHSMKMMCRNLSGYLFISVVLSDVNGIMAVIGDNVHSLQTLSYSRKFEKQADNEGLDLMKLNRVNPNGMTRLFSRIQAESNNLLPEFLSSHPLTKERIKYIDRIIKREPYLYVNNVRLEGLFKEIKK